MAINTPARRDFVISRSTDTDAYGLWRVDYDSADLLTPVLTVDAKAKFDRTHQIVSIGHYLLEWGPLSSRRTSRAFLTACSNSTRPARIRWREPGATGIGEDEILGIPA